MKYITLPLILLLGAHALANERRVLTNGERVVLACLGMIGSEKPDRIAKAERLLAAQDEMDLFRPLATALRCNPSSLRVYAAGRLAKLDDERAAQPLLHRIVREPKAEVRLAFADALRRRGAKQSVAVLGRALWSKDERIAQRAAEALGVLGDRAAMAYLVARWSARAGDFPKSYFTQMQQNNYLQDFDVEVA